MKTGYRINEHKTLRRCPGPLLNVLDTFNLRPLSRGMFFHMDDAYQHTKREIKGIIKHKSYITVRTGSLLFFPWELSVWSV